jgi:hypothetical protein
MFPCQYKTLEEYSLAIHQMIRQYKSLRHKVYDMSKHTYKHDWFNMFSLEYGMNYIAYETFVFGPSIQNADFFTGTMVQFQMAYHYDQNNLTEREVLKCKHRKRVGFQCTTRRFNIKQRKRVGFVYDHPNKGKYYKNFKSTLLDTFVSFIFCTGFTWEIERIIWIGVKKNYPSECHFAKLPRDIVIHIFNMVCKESVKKSRFVKDDMVPKRNYYYDNCSVV